VRDLICTQPEAAVGSTTRELRGGAAASAGFRGGGEKQNRNGWQWARNARGPPSARARPGYLTKRPQRSATHAVRAARPRAWAEWAAR
jgi:hypothetical protein